MIPFLSTGCSKILESKFSINTTLDDQFTRIGTNILHQMKEISSHRFPTSDHDLFLEQAIVCKWIGMDGCFSRSHITTILNWQDQSGCYKGIFETEKPKT